MRCGNLRKDVHGGRIRADGGCIDPGLCLLHGEVVDEVASLKVIGRVEDELATREQIGDIVGNQIGDVSADANAGVELRDLAPRGLGLGQRLQGIGFVEEHLALKIGGLDEVAIDQGEGADPGARQQRGCGCPGCSAADDRHVSCGKPGLSFGTYTGEENLAGVSLLVLDGEASLEVV